MVNTEEYRAKFEERCLAAGLTKLDKPVDTEEFVYCAMEVQDGDNFDIEFFEPTMKSLIRSIAESEKREFYRLDVGCVDNVIIFTSSRGDNSAQLALSQFVE